MTSVANTMQASQNSVSVMRSPYVIDKTGFGLSRAQKELRQSVGAAL